MDSDLIPRDKYVICYVAKHLACIKGLDLFDTWDCSWTYAYKDNKPISKNSNKTILQRLIRIG